MTLTNDRKKLIDKVTKLLNLANNEAATEGEAENAKRMAAELLAKHNISVTEMMGKGEQKFEQDTIISNYKESQKFDDMLHNIICKFNGVALIKTYNTEKRKTMYRLVGSDDDIEATKYMIDIVYNQRKAAYNIYTKEYIRKNGKAKWDSDWTDWTNWHNGFTFGVQDKLEELKSMADRKTQEWGLVPVDPYALALQWYHKNVEQTRMTGQRKSRYSHAGREAGRNVNINKGVESGATKLLN